MKALITLVGARSYSVQGLKFKMGEVKEVEGEDKINLFKSIHQFKVVLVKEKHIPVHKPVHAEPAKAPEKDDEPKEAFIPAPKKRGPKKKK